MTTAAVRPVLADRIVGRSSTATNLALVGAGALAVGLLAQVSIPLWPVPAGCPVNADLYGAWFGGRPVVF